MLNLPLKLFKDELPELKHYSTSYGGYWYSPWILVVTPSGGGSAEVNRFNVGWSRQHEPVPETTKAMTGKIGTRPWKEKENCAWIYCKDIETVFGVEQ